MKRILNITLALIMVFTLIPFQVFAETSSVEEPSEQQIYIYQDGKNITDKTIDLSCAANLNTTNLEAKDQNGNTLSDVEWSSSDTLNLTISADGEVIAKRVGGFASTVKVTAETKSGKTASCNVRITLQGMTLQIDNVITDVGAEEFGSIDLCDAGIPSNRIPTLNKWLLERVYVIESSNEDVVSKDDIAIKLGFRGRTLLYYVTPKSPGQATIKIGINDEYLSTEGSFTVSTSEGMKFEKDNFTLAPGETTKIEARVEPVSSEKQEFTYKSNDPKVATVAEDGTITAVANGKTDIVVTQNGGSNYTGKCRVTVIKAGMYLVDGDHANINDMSKWTYVKDNLQISTDENVFLRYFSKDYKDEYTDEHYQSSNTDVIKVINDYADLSPVANGTAEIRAILLDGTELGRCTVTVNVPGFEDAVTDIKGNYGPQGEYQTTLEMTGKNISTNSANGFIYENYINTLIDKKNAEFSFTASSIRGDGDPKPEDYVQSYMLDHIKLYKKSDMKTPIASFDENGGLNVDKVEAKEITKNPTSVTFSVEDDVLDYDTEYALVFDRNFRLNHNIRRDAVFFFKTAPAQAVKLDKESAELKKEATLQLNVLKDDEAADAYEGEVKWASSDESVATVDNNGLVTAVGRGEAEITATTVDGNQVAKCTITVKPHIIGVDGVQLGWKLNDEVIEITDEMAAAGFDTQEKVIGTLLDVLSQEVDYDINEDNSAVFDLRLMMRVDGGEWVEATEENIPEEGVYINLGYPEGIDPEDYDFTVVRMLPTETDGYEAGSVEIMDATEVNDGDVNGLLVNVDSSSPIAVSWKNVEENADGDVPGELPSELPDGIDKDDVVKNIDDTAKTGDDMNLMLLFGFMIAAVIAAGAVFFTRKSRQ